MYRRFTLSFVSKVALITLSSIALMSVGDFAHAAPCTNSYASGASAPVGYAPAWNPLTAARELLVQGTECTTSTATVKVGSGAQTQLVYNKGYYYTGSTWKEYSLTSTTALQSNAWYTGTAQASIQLPQTVTYVVGYVCQQQGSTWKCGCRDATCSTSYWQLQAVKGAAALPPDSGGGSTGGGITGGYVAGGPQCTGATPPPQAAAIGLTKLAFCEDFSDPSRIDFSNAPVQGKTTFVAMRAGNIFNAATEVRSDFTFTPEGTLESRSKATNYQADFISTWPKGGGSYGGFAVSKNSTGWYVEARLKHNTWSGSKGFFAFWSMATCHLYGSCLPYIEPDFYEYIGGRVIHATHYWTGPGQRQSTQCGVAANSDRTQFFTTGVLYGPDIAYIRSYDNEKLTCDKSKSTYPQMNLMKSQDFPIMFGTGPNQPYTIDWVRVWTKP